MRGVRCLGLGIVAWYFGSDPMSDVMIELHINSIWGFVIQNFPYMNYSVPLSSSLERKKMQLFHAIPVVEVVT